MKMKTYPLHSITIEQAEQKQFHLRLYNETF